jgi:hypothetical protein
VTETAALKQAFARRREAAARYRPEKVKLLVVAEAPPDELTRYFYFEDVTEHDDLFRYICKGVLGRKPNRDRKRDALEELRERGVFLIDLQEETPRDRTPLAAFVPALVERCRALRPDLIVLVKVTVFDAAYGALRRAGLPVSPERIPFPTSGRQLEFEQHFATALGSLTARNG